MRTDRHRWQLLAPPSALTRRAWSEKSRGRLWRARWAASLVAITIIVLVPYFGGDDPPGVDAPTFLHFGWVFEQWANGSGGSFLNDPWWYTGIPYLQAYSPGGYGAAGLLAAITPFGLATAFRLVMAAGLVGTVLTTYWLARTTGLRPAFAFLAGLLVVLSYPVIAGIGIYGWLPTLASMPMAMASYVLVEKWVRTGSRRDALIAGALLGIALVAHHMTAIAFGIAIAVRLVMFAFDTPGGWKTVHRPLVAIGAACAVASAWWAIPFLVNTISVGFERELAGNWEFGMSVFAASVFDRGQIGVETYPSYIGLVQGVLGIAGAIYAIAYRTPLRGIGVVAAVLFWFSMGAGGNPLIRIYPLSGLDVSRFAFYVAPFLAVLTASVMQHTTRSQWAPKSIAVTPVLIAVVLVLPLIDTAAAQDTLLPVEEPPQVTTAIDWIGENVPVDSRVLAVGYRNSDGYWIPARAGVPIMDGWYDEGAKNWRNVRDYRLMGWLQDVDAERLHEIMVAEKTEYLVITEWDTTDNPELFGPAVTEHPDLFQLEATLDKTVVYRVR